MRTLSGKIKNRLRKIVYRVVPYNTHLRPHSFCPLNADMPQMPYAQEVVLHHVYPGLVTTLDVPDDLYNACSEYWKPNRQVVTDYLVTEVPNGRICTDNECSIAIISSYNRLLDNVSLNLRQSKVTGTGFHRIFEQRYFTQPVKFAGTVFSMLTGGAGLNNISHWFLDVLPRLHLLHKSGLYSQVDWFLVPSLQHSYQRETLQLLGIPEDKLIAGDAFPHLTADTIIASTAPRGNHTLVPEWVCNFIRDSFLPFMETGNQSMEAATSIYISRSDSKIRKVTNEPELIEMLEQHGFTSIVAGNLSIVEKIKLFSNANRIVSATGAGLINMLFCKPGTKVIELFNEGFVVEPFYDIATKLGLDYEYVICKNRRKIHSIDQGLREHLTVDLTSLTERLTHKNKNAKLQQLA